MQCQKDSTRSSVDRGAIYTPHLITSFPNYPSVISGDLEITIWASFDLFPRLECLICPLFPEITLFTRPSARPSAPDLRSSFCSHGFFADKHETDLRCSTFGLLSRPEGSLANWESTILRQALVETYPTCVDVSAKQKARHFGIWLALGGPSVNLRPRDLIFGCGLLRRGQSPTCSKSLIRFSPQ